MRIYQFASEDEWLAWRLAGVTASDIAAAVTGSYGGLYGVVAKKRGLYIDDRNIAQKDRGHRWEPAVTAAVEALTGLWVCGEQIGIEHDRDPRWKATPDGLLSTEQYEPTGATLEALLEVKSTGVGQPAKWDYYQAQVEWSLMVSGLPRALIALATIDDSDDTIRDLRFRWVDADHWTAEAYVEIAETIWQHVEDGTLPDPDGAEALDIVKAVTSRADAAVDAVDLTDLEDTISVRDEWKAEKARLEKAIDHADAIIRARLGPATKGRTAGGWKVSLSEPAKILTDGGKAWLLEQRPDCGVLELDRRRLEADDPDLVEKAKERAGARTLRVTAPKAGR